VPAGGCARGAVTFQLLALLVAAGLAGPLLAWSDRLRIPVVIGELLAGIAIGDTGTRWVDPRQPTLVVLADVGFALVMFVAGSHVPVRDRALATGARSALLRLLLVAAVATGLGLAVGLVFGTGHAALYAVLFASSSAAVILPIADSLHLTGPGMLRVLPQVAIADAACIVALPLALDPAHALRAALGAGAVILASAVVLLLFLLADRRGWRLAVHRRSQERGFAMELRIGLLALLLLAALAVQLQVSIMLAGFCLGLAVAAVGEPHRLVRQMFALTEGLFAPLFFVWLGASLDLRQLGTHPQMILLGVVLGVGAILAHGVTALTRIPVPEAVLTAAQLGVPIAAATLGQQLGLLRPGESSALLLGALITVGASAVAGRIAARRQGPASPSPAASAPAS
jgi:Kef-type K+ transport system membrane component KefB